MTEREKIKSKINELQKRLDVISDIKKGDLCYFWDIGNADKKRPGEFGSHETNGFKNAVGGTYSYCEKIKIAPEWEDVVDGQAPEYDYDELCVVIWKNELDDLGTMQNIAWRNAKKFIRIPKP